ncbi:discoidin domain-containing protein [Blastococcus montanus]|uniref:discoidin domain-containing protein n=1 Tax=Blastococcus montanus TaxID=3144973 RepID=UPI00320A7037
MPPLLRRLLLAPVAVVLLAGCAAPAVPSAAGPEVRAAEQVFVEAPVVVPDPSGTTATLQVSTSIDMACAVVFGRDESLGEGIATDADMGGGAHADHRATMRGLEPGTEYFYRVQGSGADGSLYRSELMSFRTLPAEAGAGAGANVAPGAEVVDVSSEFSDAFAAANAVDGDLGTEWSSRGDGDDASITVDLGRDVRVGGVALRSRSMSDGSSVVETFTVTVDGGQTYGPFEAGAAAVVNELDVTGRVLRIDAVSTTGGNTGAAEIEVVEAA